MPTALLAMPGSMPAATESPILFFDGVCGLCNSSVDFVMRRDHQRMFQFAPLQGETAAAKLDSTDRENLNSMVVLTPDGPLRRTSAVVYILRRLPGLWPLAGSLLWLVPRPLRDLGYGLVASNRYRLFGKKETCRLPTPEEAGRLLP